MLHVLTRPFAAGTRQSLLQGHFAGPAHAAMRRRLISVLAPEVYSIKPDRLPANTLPLTKLDLSMMHFPGVTAHNFYRGPLKVDELKASLARVVAKNPSLAGRIRSTEGDGLEVHYENTSGCHFYIRTLPADMEAKLELFDSAKIAERPLEWEALIEELGIANTGPGPVQIDQDAPLLTATYLEGKRVSTLSLSVSHLLGDGATKMNVLKLWDQEFAKPNSTNSLSGREAVEATDAQVKTAYSAWSQAAMEAFYPHIYEKHVLARDLKEYNMVVVRIREETMKKIKAAEVQKNEPGTVFSGQDALIAWLGNVLGAKWFAFTVDLRGRAEGLEKDAMGNAFMTWYGTPEKGPGQFSAMDVRNTIKSQGRNGAAALEEALFSGLEDSIDVNSWVKLQHQPQFGGNFLKQVRAIGSGALPFLFRLNYHVVYQPQGGEYVMYHFGLRDDQAMKLQLAWRKLGEDCVNCVSGVELMAMIKEK
mmetsp:Transcript_110763/g.286325  ORF Transcript_110763/g.286325 Transcript_110763/m.286325 type:complete len:477 (+) Transcript_110763:82-1512(+)